ncbi:MAG: DUF5320 domain-containing protein [Candidatus Aenigmarchaeota archaeon]|nr:DUF5320 domain-containing protein [Candidatus Aenigmarchaeota archaeon]
MPFGDGTGPEGLGPLTGRGLGYCAGYDSPGFTRGIPMGGRGFARGFGRGFRARRFIPRRFIRPIYNPYYDYIPQRPLTKEDEKKLIEQDIKNIEEEIKYLEQEKKEIEKRLKEL